MKHIFRAVMAMGFLWANVAYTKQLQYQLQITQNALRCDVVWNENYTNQNTSEKAWNSFEVFNLTQALQAKDNELFIKGIYLKESLEDRSFGSCHVLLTEDHGQGQKVIFESTMIYNPLTANIHVLPTLQMKMQANTAMYYDYEYRMTQMNDDHEYEVVTLVKKFDADQNLRDEVLDIQHLFFLALKWLR